MFCHAFLGLFLTSDELLNVCYYVLGIFNKDAMNLKKNKDTQYG